MKTHNGRSHPQYSWRRWSPVSGWNRSLNLFPNIDEKLLVSLWRRNTCKIVGIHCKNLEPFPWKHYLCFTQFPQQGAEKVILGSCSWGFCWYKQRPQHDPSKICSSRHFHCISSSSHSGVSKSKITIQLFSFLPLLVVIEWFWFLVDTCQKFLSQKQRCIQRVL